MEEAVLAIPDLPIYPCIFSLQGNMKVLLTYWEHILVCMVGQRKGACWKGDKWCNSALKILETELG